MGQKKFPAIIHVTREEEPSGDSWLQTHENGVTAIDEPVAVAIYKLVEVGRVEIQKSFQKARKK